MNSPKAPPPTVTRFFGNAAYSLDLLANKLITFVHISVLNDPFDPYFFFETDFEEKRSNLLKYVTANHPADLSWFKRNVTANSWDETVRALKERVAHWKKSVFVFSTSGEHEGLHPKDNLYMWGHYGNGHRGVAIEFDSQALATAVTKFHTKFSDSTIETNNVWTEIEYRTSLSPITAAEYFAFLKQEHKIQIGTIATRQRTNLEDRYDLMNRVKSDVWEREREWRLMWHSDDTRMKIYRIPIDADAVKNIFLGLGLAESLKSDVTFEARRNFPGALVFQAKKRHGDFGLVFELLP